MTCLFCKIVAGDIPAKRVYEDANIIAFNDIATQAPHHILIIPRAHISTINDLTAENNTLIGDMMLVAKKIATGLNIADAGYRVIMNCNKMGGQAVYHIHFHLLGGRQMEWPPG